MVGRFLYVVGILPFVNDNIILLLPIEMHVPGVIVYPPLIDTVDVRIEHKLSEYVVSLTSAVIYKS